MIKNKYYILLISIFMVLTFQSKGTHNVGCDIEYECVGKDSFKVRITYYKDCRGSKLEPLTLHIEAIPSNCGFTAYDLTLNQVGCKDVTPVCPGACTKCWPDQCNRDGKSAQGVPEGNTACTTFIYGIEKVDFEGLVVLKNAPKKCCRFRFSYLGCNRNYFINTIASAVNCLYTYADMDRCKAPCNNSPTFSNAPLAFLCPNKCVCMNNGAKDIVDFDSLSYEIAKCYKLDTATTVDYDATNKYSYKTPIDFKGWPNPKPNPAIPCSGFKMDSVFGDLCFTPTKEGTFIFALAIKEWRRNTKTGKMEQIGLIRRDMQYIVLNASYCNNNNPELKGPYLAVGCSGDNICFTDMKTTDPDSVTVGAVRKQRDTVRVSWNGGIPKATFTHKFDGDMNEQWSLCWQTTDADASTTPYFFTVNAEDNFCPKNGRSSRAYAIYVKKSPKLLREYTNLACGEVRLKATPDEKNQGWADSYLYEWTVPYPGGTKYYVKDTVVKFTSPGTHLVKVRADFSGCLREWIDTIQVPQFLVADLGNDTSICIGSTVTKKAVTNYQVPPVKYYWMGDTIGGTTDTFTLKVTQDTMVFVRVVDSVFCEYIDSVKLSVNPLPDIKLIPKQRACKGDSLDWDAGDNNGKGVKIYNWYNAASPTITFSNDRNIKLGDSALFYCKITDSLNCVSSDSAKAFFNKVPNVNAGNDLQQCRGDSVTLTATGADQYAWIFATTADTFSFSDTPFWFQAWKTMDIVVRGVNTFDSVSCFDNDTFKIVLNIPPMLDLKAKEYCVDDPIKTITVIANNHDSTNTSVKGLLGAYRYFTNDTLLSKGLTGSSLNIAKAGPTYQWPNPYPRYVVVEFTDNKGCKRLDSVEIYIHPLPPTHFKPKVLCVDATPFLLTQYGFPNDGAGSSYGQIWSASCGTCIQKNGGANSDEYIFNPKLANMGANVITYSYKDGNKCDSVYTDTFFVKPIPVITKIDPSEICISSDTINLNQITAIQPNDGNWKGKGVIQDSLFVVRNSFTPPFVGTNPQFIKLIYYSPGNGCPISDSIIYKINPLPPVTVLPDRDICLDSGEWTMPAVNNGDWYVNNVKKPAFNTITEGLGKHTIKLIYTHPTTGCVNSDSFYITVKDTPWVQINNVLSLCEGDTASLGCAVANSDGVSWSSSTGGTFTDINGEQTQYIPTAQDIQNGYCFLTVTTITGLKCPDDDTVTIIIHPNPVPKFKGDVLIGCSPHSVQFTDTTANLPAGCRYVWNFGDPESGILNTDTNPNPIHLFINKGSDTKKFDISLTITTPYGCTRSLNIKEYISVYPIPVAKFDPRPRKATIALPRIRLQNLSKNVDELTKYEWTFGDPAGGTSKEKNPTYWYTNTDTGTYIIWLKTTTQYNCIDSTFEIVYIGPEMTVFIPNAFSPDNFGPGKNNFFWVEADNYKGFEMFVFNRWGEEVFFADQRLPGWNGMYQGKPAQEDVYVYQVNIQNLDGKWYHYNGTVTLLR